MNPNAYDYYQCDKENYNSNDSPEEQAESEAARSQYAEQLIAAMRTAVAEVPSYAERYAWHCPKCGNPFIPADSLVDASDFQCAECNQRDGGAFDANLD